MSTEERSIWTADKLIELADKLQKEETDAELNFAITSAVKVRWPTTFICKRNSRTTA